MFIAAANAIRFGRKQRGLKLPPMGSTPEVRRQMEGLTYSINGKTKPKQLQPLLDGWQVRKGYTRNIGKQTKRSGA